MNIRAIINLDNLKSNFNLLRSNLPENVKLCGVVKADAYGHGGVMVAKELENLDIDYLAVARICEAVEIRKSGVKAPIFLLSFSDEIELAIKFDVEICVYSFEMAKFCDNVSRSLNKTLNIHIAVDTGMGRIGLFGGNEVQEILEISRLKNLKIKALFTHFSNADKAKDEFSKVQLKRLKAIATSLEPLNIPLIHASNSAATLRYEEANLDMVRGGISLYGFHPLG